MKRLAFLAALILAACESEPRYALEAPPDRERPQALPHEISPAHQTRRPENIGSAGPLKVAMVGSYMDAQEKDFRARLHAPVARVGDDLVVVLKNDFLFQGMQLSGDGGDMLERVAELLRHYDHTGVQIGAYTDTSGTPEQNLAVSIRRAKAVADALIGDGVTPSRVSSQGFGPTHLKIATGANVKEPRNRRIEIRIIAHPSA